MPNETTGLGDIFAAAHNMVRQASADRSRQEIAHLRDAIVGSVGLLMILIGVATGQNEPIYAGISLCCFVGGFLVGKYGRRSSEATERTESYHPFGIFLIGVLAGGFCSAFYVALVLF